MIDIGINYLTQGDMSQNAFDKIYKLLVKKGYINTIKFPGKYCNYDGLKKALRLVEDTNIKIDIHGFPGIVPSISSKNYIKNVDWNKLKDIINKSKYIKRISTHIGLENKDRLRNYKYDELMNNYNINVLNVKEKLKNILCNQIDIGVENIPGGFDFDIETIKPNYVSDCWRQADFGVFDISHAKLSAKQLKITYEEYLKMLKYKEKVKILHISGNVDETNKYENKPDKHVLIHHTEIKDVIKTIQEFHNLDLIISEYSFNTKYSYEKELIIESIVLFTMIKTKDYNLSKYILNFLEKCLQEDISNIEQIIEIIDTKIKNYNEKGER